MKRSLLALCAILTMSLSSHAQDDGSAYSQGQSTISLGYGVGNVFKTLFTLSGATVSSTGPFALTYEYGVTDKISAGLSVGYSSVTGVTTDNSGAPSFYDVETQKLTAFSAVVRGNYHFGSSPNFDPYIGLGIGYYNFTFTDKDVQTDNTTSPPTVTTSNGSGAFSIPGAIGYTAQLGAKYYFVPSFGAMAEIGYVGGSYLQVGLTYKLGSGSGSSD
jgi:outer membrane protein W